MNRTEIMKEYAKAEKNYKPPGYKKPEKTKQEMEHERLLVHLGLELKAMREKRGWTQKQLADKLGVALPRISEFERGKWNLTFQYLVKITTALGGHVNIKIS
jgi:ribosome-binding protein aMBF1 (putative translation factor)